MTTIYRSLEELPAAQESFTAMLLNRVESSGGGHAFSYPDDSERWHELTWQETGDEATLIAAGLIALGVEPEQRVAIAANTSMKWILSQFGIALAGGAVTTVYASTGADDEQFILSDSNSRVLFAEDHEQLAKVSSKREELPELHKVVLFSGSGEGSDWALNWDEFKEIGRDALANDPGLVARRAQSVTGDQLATLIYTSGTTGRPKGVEITHASWAYVGAAIREADVIDDGDLQFLWLPMAHVFGTVLMAVTVEMGFPTAVDGRVPKIMENLATIKPTFMGAVPRIFEKAHSAINALAKSGGPEMEAGFAWALDIGRRYHQAIADGVEPDEQLKADYAKADEEALSNVRALLGGRMRFFISGSAPLFADIAEFFAATGMPILEGYGLTETSAMATICRPNTRRAGYVGEPQPGTEIMLAEDGEILVRSPAVMRGYRNQPTATSEVLLADGWFATGDIGEFDEFNRLKITDRKKDLFKTSGGKYVAPSAIESQFKALCSVASNMVVHANNRKFVSAIVSLDPDSLNAWAATVGKEGNFAELSQDEDLIAFVQGSIDRLNDGLNNWEQVKKFVILENDLSIESGELTPSLKVKRRVVEAHNQDLLDGLYA
jgi:long-chain acyl-CoA synthetase